MPNHITNVIEFDCPPEQFVRIAESLKSDPSEPLGQVDFNKLIPMPASLDIEAGSRGETGYRAYREFVSKAKGLGPVETLKLEQQYKERFSTDPMIWELGKQYDSNIQKYGCPNWYDWCVDNWNTKWNAYECTPVEPADRRLEFLTAWAGVPPIVEAISNRCPSVTVRYAWADENIGYNVGKAVYENGKEIASDIPREGSKEAYEMAADILGGELSEWGLYLTPDGKTYEFMEEPPAPVPAASSRAHAER